EEPLGHGGLASVDVGDHADVADHVDLRHDPPRIARSDTLAPMRKAVLVVILVASARVASADPDYARAATLYKQAETEMAAGQYSDAASDYAEAYDITKDPVLFFKIASADDKAGRCDLALTYYRRYLNEGNPNEEYKATTEDRIKACEA